MSSMAFTLRTFVACLFGISMLAKPCESASVLDNDRYLVASFPKEGKIVYLKEGQKVLRDLIVGGFESLGAITIDQTNARLYVSDTALAKIYWFQLVALPDGRLTTDGRKSVAIEGLVAKSLECDGAGNLYVGGQAITAVTPSAPAPPLGIHKFAWAQLFLNDHTVYNPEGVWNTANSGDPPKMWDPNTLVTDGSRIFWGNANQGGTHGAVAEGGTGGGGLKVHVDQGESVGSVALTPEFLFYSTESGIYGVPVYKREAGCGKPVDTKKAALNPAKLSLKGGGEGPVGPCRRISSEITSTRGMVWDGDGTVFTADPEKGIYSFPSGNSEPHRVTKVVEFVGLYDMDLLQVSNDSVRGSMSLMCMVIIVATTQLQKWI